MATTTISGEATDQIGRLIGADMNSTADQAIPLHLYGATKYIIEKIVVTNASANLTLAAGGVYSAASKGGTAIVAAIQVYSALTGSSKFVPLTLATLTDVLTGATIYFALTTAQGSASTADIYVYGRVLL